MLFEVTLLTENANHKRYRVSLRSSSKRVPSNPSPNGVSWGGFVLLSHARVATPGSLSSTGESVLRVRKGGGGAFLPSVQTGGTPALLAGLLSPPFPPPHTQDGSQALCFGSPEGQPSQIILIPPPSRPARGGGGGGTRKHIPGYPQETAEHQGPSDPFPSYPPPDTPPY
jgi:hypothetical protein